MKYFVLIAALAGCASFESEEIVIDMRVLAMAATVPEQMVDVDLDNPPEPLALLDQLVPTTMCALVADPVEARRIDYRLTLCVLTNDERCDDDAPTVPLAHEIAEDPELAVPAPQLCATVNPDGNLAGIALEALEGDVLRGLGGVDYGVELQVQPEGNTDPDLLLFAGKTLRISPRIPAERTANSNPSIDHFDGAKDGINPVPLPMGRCVDQTAPLTLVPTQRVRIEPIEPPDAREVYVVPTLDGQSETFTESLTYQWLAAGGSFSAGTTGGPRDVVSGNPAPLFSDFRAPAEIDGVTDIPLWIIQRDERLGSVWYETCIRVVPE